jgi:peptidoglycan/LPS O-acetylase OafA/YrhL
MATDPDRGRAYFPCFDGYRAIAISGVFLLHVSFASGFIYRHPSLSGYLFNGDFGVSLFFAISGFLLYRPFVAARLAGRPAMSVRTFLGRRALRIVPAYWVALTIVVYVLDQAEIRSLEEFVLLYGLQQIYSEPFHFHGIQQAWSLGTEVSFYLFLPFYAAGVRALSRALKRERDLALDLGLVAALYATGLVCRYALMSWRGQDTFSLTTLPVYLDLFAVGMGLAVLSAWDEARIAPSPALVAVARRPWVCVLIAATAYWLVVNRLDIPVDYSPLTAAQWVGRDALFGVMSLALLVPGVFGPSNAGGFRRFLCLRPVQWVGLVSYGIYLWHEAAIELYQDWTDTPFFSGALPAVVCGTLALTLAIATASYVLVERPALRLKGRAADPRDRALTPQ